MLVRVLAVPQSGRLRLNDAERTGEGVGVEHGGDVRGFRGCYRFQGGGDGAVVSGRRGEGLSGKLPAGSAREGALMDGELFGEARIVGRGGDDGYVFKVFRRGADHGRAANVDVLDDLGGADVGLERGLLEGVEVDDDEVDGLDAVGIDGGDVFGVLADVEDATMDPGVQGFDSSVEHLGETGELRDVADSEPGLAKGAGCAAG